MNESGLEKLRGNGVRIGLDADGDLAIAGGLSLEDAKFIQANYDALLAALKVEAEAEPAPPPDVYVPREISDTQFEHLDHDAELQRRRYLAVSTVQGKLNSYLQSEAYLFASIDAESARQAKPQQGESIGGRREPLTARYRRVRG